MTWTRGQNGRGPHRSGAADRGRRSWLVPAHLSPSPVGEARESLRQAAFRELEISLLRDGGIGAAQSLLTLRRRFPELINESLVNVLGYILLAKRDLATAIEAFKLNVEAFPESSNAHDSLAEAYLAAGETGLALAHYRRSVELDPTNANGVEMLERLRRRDLREN